MRVVDLAGKIVTNESAGSSLAATGRPEAESAAVKGPRTRPDLTIWVHQSVQIEDMWMYEFMNIQIYGYEDIISIEKKSQHKWPKIGCCG